MGLLQVLAVLSPLVAQSVTRQGLRSSRLNVVVSEATSSSFAQYAKELGRSYVAGTSEYSERARLYTESLQRIQAQNARKDRLWTAGPNHFMDWTLSERRALQGYKPSRKHLGSRSMAALQVGSGAGARSNMSLDDDAFIGEGAHPRNQGNCGSCWAISASEAVEAQLRKAGNDVRVSAQALVDCVPNPHHCGGSGGCDGATGELAYAFMQKYGIPLESDLPYHARTGQCGMQPGASSYPASKRVTVSGWDSLPTNQGKGLMQALVEVGSAVVNVDGNDWFDYSNGIYDGCNRDADIGHAVLAKGYGNDPSTGKNFWLIQNSWGTGWGENGDIRLLRHDSDDDYCGTDSKPQDGTGCDGGPATVHVCGMCGVLFDAVVPKDVQVVGDM